MYFIGKFLLMAGSGSRKPKCENEGGYGRGGTAREKQP